MRPPDENGYGIGGLATCHEYNQKDFLYQAGDSGPEEGCEDTTNRRSGISPF
jgi:hypothetical protein